MNQQKNRYLILSFSISFFVLTLTLLFLLTMVPPRPQQAAARTQAAGDTGLDYLPTAEEALNVLLMGAEKGSQEAGLFLLMRFDPARGSVPIISLPANTLVENNGHTETLAEAYRYGGAEYTKDILSKTLDVTIHRYVRMDQAAFVACAGAVGSIQFSLDREVPVSSGGAQMVLQAGEQLLDGPRIAALLSSGEYGDESSRLLADVAVEVVNQRIDICQSAVLDRVFETVINLVDTDISYLDYQERKQAGIYLAERESPPAISITPAGREEEDGFALSDTFVALLRQAFS